MNSTPESIISASERLNRYIQSNPSAINDVADINQKTYSPQSNNSNEKKILLKFDYDGDGKPDKFYPSYQGIRERAFSKWFSITDSEDISQRQDFEILKELEIALPKGDKWVLAKDLQKHRDDKKTEDKTRIDNSHNNSPSSKVRDTEKFKNRTELVSDIANIYGVRQSTDAGILHSIVSDILIHQFSIKNAPKEILSSLNKLKGENPKSVSPNIDEQIVSPGLIAAVILDEVRSRDYNDFIQDKSAKDKLIEGKIDKNTEIKAGEVFFIPAYKKLSDTSIGMAQVKPNTYIGELVEKGYLDQPNGWSEDTKYKIATEQILDEAQNPKIVAAVLIGTYNFRAIDLPGLPQDQTYKALNDPNKGIKEKRQIIASLYSRGKSANPSNDKRYVNIATASLAFDEYFKTV